MSNKRLQAGESLASNSGQGPSEDDRGVNKIGSKIVREIILPVLEKEVNEDKNFAQLRQIYHSLILATWYKKQLKDSILNKVYSDQKKTAGVEVNDKEIKQKIYTQYLQAFKSGVFDLINEDVSPGGEVIPHRYFSGGIPLFELSLTISRYKICLRLEPPPILRF